MTRDSNSLLDRIESAYHRLWRDDNNTVSQYSADANENEVLFALIYSYVTGDPTDLARNNRSLTANDLNAWDTVTWDEVREYASANYHYEVCERCDSDICQHVNN
jgi:hypothetical protein